MVRNHELFHNLNENNVAGQYALELHKNKGRGTPLAILWAAEWWLMDGEFIRWGRYYRMGGYYAFAVAWYA